MMIAMAIATRAMASKCRRCSETLSFSANAELKTATNWKPNRACMPGKTIRHSSSRYSAALDNGSSSLFSPALFNGLGISEVKLHGLVQTDVSKKAQERDPVAYSRIRRSRDPYHSFGL